jgi:peptide deformylase
MDKDTIITLPNSHLRERSRKVGLITEDIKKLVNGMKEATLDWEAERKHEVGVALAAIQIDMPLKIVIVRNNFDNKSDTTFTVFINPVITKYEGAIKEDYEGCLSIPEIYGRVPRYSKVRVRALDTNGREFRVTAEGFLARVLQHEIDHTNGVVFIDHIKDRQDAFFKLKENGQLEQIDYEKDIRKNRILW